MTKADQSLILEVLKQIQADIAGIKNDVGDLKHGMIQVREDVHSVDGHVISVQKSLLDHSNRLSRIESRLNLVDA